MAQTANHHHDEHKRVSFGTEEQVTKIIYDDGYDEYNNVQATRTTTSFTSPDAPPNKVKVTSEERDIPRPISPPAQLENPTISATSPPLPALIKKMEHHDLDNPFRPQENLYHEVDPIVEAYKNRPFPPSPVGSPIPHDNHASSMTPQHNSSQNAHETSHISYSSTPQKTSTHPGNVRASEKRNSETVHITEVDALLPATDMPPPNKAEVVHLDKKKKCACCSVQ